GRSSPRRTGSPPSDSRPVVPARSSAHGGCRSPRSASSDRAGSARRAGRAGGAPGRARRDPRAGRRGPRRRPPRWGVRRRPARWPEPPYERPSLRARLTPPRRCILSGAAENKPEATICRRSGEGDGGRADDQPLALIAFEPDVELDGAGGLVLLRHGPAQTDGAPREHEAAERGPQAAEHAGAGPGLDERRQEAHAHVPGRDHAGEALPPRPLVVGEAGADVDRLRDALGVEPVALVADAEGGVTDQARARLGVLGTGLAERTGEGDQLLGRDRPVAGVVELLAEDRRVDLERHAPTLG